MVLKAILRQTKSLGEKWTRRSAENRPRAWPGPALFNEIV
jgi:hypothetical protein